MKIMTMMQMLKFHYIKEKRKVHFIRMVEEKSTWEKVQKGLTHIKIGDEIVEEVNYPDSKESGPG